MSEATGINEIPQERAKPSRQRRQSQLVSAGKILEEEGIKRETDPVRFKKLRRKFAEKSIKEINESDRDPLTGLLNRKGALKKLDNEVERAKRSGINATIIFLDVNGLKKINDERGHEEGDRLLLSVADIFVKMSRKIDGLARWGGDEFLAILPQTNTDQAEEYWQRLKKEFDSANIRISAGATLLDPNNIDRSISQADTTMYKAKDISRDTNESLMLVHKENND